MIETTTTVCLPWEAWWTEASIFGVTVAGAAQPSRQSNERLSIGRIAQSRVRVGNSEGTFCTFKKLALPARASRSLGKPEHPGSRGAALKPPALPRPGPPPLPRTGPQGTPNAPGATIMGRRLGISRVRGGGGPPRELGFSAASRCRLSGRQLAAPNFPRGSSTPLVGALRTARISALYLLQGLCRCLVRIGSKIRKRKADEWSSVNFYFRRVATL